MKRKNSVLKLLFMMTLTLFSALVIVACTPTNTDKADVASAKTALEVGFTAPDTKDSVKSNLRLPTTGEKDVTITWQSSHPSVVTTAGVVTRPANDTSVTLTATLTKGDEADTKNFQVKVIATETEPVTAQEALDALTITGDTLELDGIIYSTTSNIVLPTTSLGFTINWLSTSNAITTAGVVTRPAYGAGDERVVLTASIGELERDFIVDVIAIQDKPAEDVLDSAHTALLLASLATAENISLPTQIIVEGESEDEIYTVTVTWVSDSDHMNNNGQVDRPLAGSDDAVVNLTATLSYGGQTKEKEFQVVVYAYAEAFTVVPNIAASQALYANATDSEKVDGVYVRIQDLSLVMKVTDGLLFVDTEGDILFAFGSQSNAYRDAQVGVLYDVVGAIDVYYGAFQLSATKNDRKPIELLVQDGDPIEPNYGDAISITELVPATQPAPYGDSNLFEYTPARITAKVMVTSTTDNYGVVLVDTSYTGDGSDLRLADGSAYENRAVFVYYSSNKDAFLALDGLEVTVDVILYAFRTDRLIHTVLFGGTLEDIEVNVTPAEVVELVGTALNTDVPQVLALEKDINLRTSYLGATIQWASSHPSIISATGEVNLPASGKEEVTLTATITMGEATKVVEFDIIVGELNIADVLGATRGEVKVTGKVVGFTANNTLILHDETGAITLFISGDFRDQLIASIGKVVEVTGSRTAFNGLQQIGTITAVEELTDTIDELKVDITDLAWNAATLMPHQNKLVSITGVEVTAVSTDSNGNISATFKLGEKTINMRWDARIAITGENVLEFLVVGDIVDIVDAPLGWNNNPQLGYYVASQIELEFDTHVVTFKDGETTLGTLEIRAGQAIGTYPATSKEGFVFQGWFSDATFDTPWLETDLVNDDVTLYAHFEELSGTLVVDTYSFAGLTEATTYVLTPTDAVVGGMTFTRLFANISTQATSGKGIVLSVRESTSWGSPYLLLQEKLVGAYKVVFDVSNWTSDARYNIDFADGIYIQTSTDGETWVNGPNFKETWNTEDSATNKIELLLEGDVYVRLFVQSAGSQTEYQLRLIVRSVEIHSYVELDDPVDVTFDLGYGEEEPVVVTIDSGETATPQVPPTRTGYDFLGWFLVDAETPFDFDTPITEDITLTARWEEIIVELETIAEASAKPDDSIVKFIGIVTGFTDYNEAFSNYDKVWLEDETGVMQVYRGSFPADLALGDKYEVEGVITSYQGQIQIAQGSTLTLVDKENTLIEPTDVTDVTTLVATDQGLRVNLTGQVVSITSNGRDLVIKVGETNITVRSQSSSDTHALNVHLLTAVVGQTVNIKAAHVEWANTVPRPLVTSVSQVEFIEFTDADKLAKAEAALVALYDDKEFNMESAVELSTEGLHGVTILWAMDPVDAIADGKWMVVTEDTLVTLTATLTLGEEEPVIVELEVTVKFVEDTDPGEGETFTETFDTHDIGTAYIDTNFAGLDGTAWSIGHSRNEDVYAIDGTGIMLRRASDSYIQITFSNGLSAFSFDYTKAFTGGSDRILEVKINDDVVFTSENFGGSTLVYQASLTDLEYTGNVVVIIKLQGSTTTNRQTTIDNISWTTNP